MLPPPTPGLHCPRTQVSTSVRIGKEKDLRVLFAQGSLTWDYKFIRLALEGDPLIKLAAVTQTTRQSILHQTIDDAEVKSGGFPATLEELSKYRVLVLSDFRAGSAFRSAAGDDREVLRRAGWRGARHGRTRHARRGLELRPASAEYCP